MRIKKRSLSAFTCCLKYPKQLDKFDLKGFVKPKKLYQVKDDQHLMLSDQLMHLLRLAQMPESFLTLLMREALRLGLIH